MNDMSFARPAPVVRELAPDAQIVVEIPPETAWPDLSGQSSFVACYPYYWENGTKAMVIARYERPDDKKPGQIKKTLFPHTFWQNADGSAVWARKGMKDPMPVYNLLDLNQHPNALVVISEGEKCADAVKAAFPDCVSITWANGTNAVKKTDFSPLEGRDVVVFPDHDDSGQAAVEVLTEILIEKGAKRVRVLDIAALGECVSENVPKGYDIADAIRDGLSVARFKEILDAHPKLMSTAFEASVAPQKRIAPIEETLSAETPLDARPSADASREEGNPSTGEADIEENPFLAYLEQEWGYTPNFPEGYGLANGGLYKHGLTGRGEPVRTFAGSPIAVVGQGRMADGETGWGCMVVFPRPDGTYATVFLPNSLSVGDGKEVRAMLAEHGFQCPNDRAGRLALADFISQSDAPDIIEITHRPGWIGDSFALPQGVISPPDKPRRIKIDMGDKKHFFAKAGQAEDWRALAGLVERSSRAAFALSVAFAAVLLKPMGESGGGFHLYGRSSRSKTTFLVLGGSVFGGGGIDGPVQSWLRTGNSAEATAAEHNDCLIALDELGVSNPDLAADLYYMLANGHGKGRATVVGSARQSVQWRVMTLSSGETSSVVHMRSTARGANKRYTGGVAVRMVDIPIEVAEDQSFEDIGCFENERAMAEHIGREARRVYGHAAPEFITHLVSDLDAHIKAAEDIKTRFIEAVTEQADDPQVKRVAGRFGVVAAAGELAVRFGVLPWRAEAAFNAAVICFSAWKDARGTSQSEEERDALRALRTFFELYGRSRFEAITVLDDPNSDQGVQREGEGHVRDRCGYRTVGVDGNAVLYVTPEAFRSEVCAGHSPEIMLRVARERGALIVGEGGHLQKNVRLPERSGTSRVYAFLPHALYSKDDKPD